MGGWEGQGRDIERVLYKELSSLSLILIVRQPQNLAETFGKMSKTCN